MTTDNKLKSIVEATLLAAGGPLSLDQLLALFLDDEQPDRRTVREVIDQIQQEYAGRGMELVEVGSGFRINVRAAFAPWVSRLWEERPARYSRALMETLALIAYRQPITRGEIEEIRGVSVSSNIMKTLIEREWVRVVGHRDVPGKPSLYATTRDFLNYFGLKSLDELPTLQEIRDLDSINQELVFNDPGEQGGEATSVITQDLSVNLELAPDEGVGDAAEEEEIMEPANTEAAVDDTEGMSPESAEERLDHE